MNKNSESMVKAFIESFEEVFDKDWSHTKEVLGIQEATEEQKEAAAKMGLESIEMVSSEGTFINPRIEDEIEDWGNRGRLLQLYRDLKENGF